MLTLDCLTSTAFGEAGVVSRLLGQHFLPIGFVLRLTRCLAFGLRLTLRLICRSAGLERALPFCLREDDLLPGINTGADSRQK